MRKMRAKKNLNSKEYELDWTSNVYTANIFCLNIRYIMSRAMDGSRSDWYTRYTYTHRGRGPGNI